MEYTLVCIEWLAREMGMLALSALVTGILWLSTVRINKRRRAGDEEGKVLGMTEEQIKRFR